MHAVFHPYIYIITYCLNEGYLNTHLSPEPQKKIPSHVFQLPSRYRFATLRIDPDGPCCAAHRCFAVLRAAPGGPLWYCPQMGARFASPLPPEQLERFQRLDCWEENGIPTSVPICNTRNQIHKLLVNWKIRQKEENEKKTLPKILCIWNVGLFFLSNLIGSWFFR